jgi:trans-aconitate 2-methyltransferase
MPAPPPATTYNRRRAGPIPPAQREHRLPPEPEPPRSRAMSWSASQYVSFENERTRPVRDLLAAVPVAGARSVVDIGCGPGNSTEVLAARFPGAAIAGFDSSPDMIAAARKRLPEVRFELSDIGAWQDPGPFDVILANAVLQWVPDHAALFPALIAKLAPGGSLAVQMPDNLEEPAHRLMREIAEDGPWAARLADAAQARTVRHDAQWYYRELRPACAAVDVWRTTYHHPLAGGAHAVVEWFKGSGLRPFLEALDDTERAAYLERYETAIAQAYPALADGTVLLPFPRLFIVATR